jgi:hypothetical protein
MIQQRQSLIHSTPYCEISCFDVTKKLERIIKHGKEEEKKNEERRMEEKEEEEDKNDEKDEEEIFGTDPMLYDVRTSYNMGSVPKIP